MLINSELKYKANINLKKSYWVCVAVCLIFSILTGVLDELPTVDNLSLIHNDGTVFETLLTVSSFSAMPNNVISYSQELVMNISDLIRIGVQTSTFLIFIFVFIFVFLLRLFILYPLNVGTKRFFMAQREDKIRFKNIFYVYQIGKTENTVKTMFFVDLYTTLWYFLFIIPGVIKSYEYMMIPYILSENPGIDVNRAFKISKEMMYGNKMFAFTFHLSFIGWFILSVFTGGLLSILYVNPYFASAEAELYAVLRQWALNSGTASRDELPGYDNLYSNDIFETPF